MTNSTIKEFAELVRDARKFIQQDLRPIISLAREPMRCPAPQVQVQAPAVQVPQLPDEPPPRPVPAKPIVAPALPKGGWELQAMPAPTDSSPLRQKLAAYTATNDPPLSVLLILPEENGMHRLFLENVSRAVTRSFASATVAIYRDGLLQEMQGKLILAPLSLLQKRFPKAQVHIPLQESGMTWIPLENLDIYAHDVTAKRALWMSIQRSFQS